MKNLTLIGNSENVALLAEKDELRTYALRKKNTEFRPSFLKQDAYIMEHHISSLLEFSEDDDW